MSRHTALGAGGAGQAAPIRIDLAGYARDDGATGHAAIIELAETADRLGFGGIWFNEFHFRRNGLPYPSLLLLGAAVLARTERLRFGTSILVLPLHHPLMLAEQIAQLDVQGGGRLDIGVGRGTEPSSFAALGLDPADARARFDECLRVMLAAWQHPVSSGAGPHWPFRDVAVGPAPLQRPHPPVYMAAVSPDSIALAARHGLALLYSLEPNEDRQIAPWRAALDGHASRKALLRASSLSRYVLVAPRRAAALAQLDGLLERLNARRAARAEAQGNPPPPPRTREQMLAGHAIAGTPEECHDQIRALCARYESRSLRVYFSANGLIPMAEAETAMRLFAAEVLPALSQPVSLKKAT